ncbi:MAG: hypothetical protein ABIA93_00575 [Candidatus Woesearchaeota archaeon]
MVSMRLLRKYAEVFQAGSYLAGGVLSIVGFVCILGLGFIMWRTKYPQPAYEFTLWQALFWQFFVIVAQNIGGIWYYTLLDNLILGIIILAGIVFGYFTLDDREPRLPALHELADMMLGKRHRR